MKIFNFVVLDLLILPAHSQTAFETNTAEPQ